MSAPPVSRARQADHNVPDQRVPLLDRDGVLIETPRDRVLDFRQDCLAALVRTVLGAGAAAPPAGTDDAVASSRALTRGWTRMAESLHTLSRSAMTSSASSGALRAPMLWGVVVGLLQAATPLVFWWLDS